MKTESEIRTIMISHRKAAEHSAYHHMACKKDGDVESAARFKEQFDAHQAVYRILEIVLS